MSYATTHRDVRAMFGKIAPRYDLTNSVLSFGIHGYWRRKLVELLAPRPNSSQCSPALVLDLCTGTGDLLPLLRHRFGEVIGADFCLPMLQAGAKKKARGFTLVQADALALPFRDQSFDIVTVAFGVRNFEDTHRGLREIARVLKPGGHLLVLEFGQPRGLFGALFRFYSRTVMPLIGGMLTGDREAYTYLPRTAGAFPCGEQFCGIVAECGFRAERADPLTGGIAYVYRAVKR